MGTRFTHPGDFSSIRKAVRLAVPSNARALFLASPTVGDSAKNWVDGGLDGSWVGTPTIASGYVNVDGKTQALETGVTEPADFTIFMVVKTPDVLGGDVPAFFSTNTGTASIGGASIFGTSLSINNASDGRWTFYTTRRTGGVDSGVTANLLGANIPTQGAWTLVMCRTDGTRIEIQDLTRSKANLITTAIPRNPTINGIRMGAKRAANTATGRSYINSAGIWQGWMADADVTLMAAQFRAIAANAGITV